MKATLNKADYRAALEKIKKIHEAGGIPNFGRMRKEYGFAYQVSVRIIPNLAGVDLDKEFDRLYAEQLANLRACQLKSQAYQRGVNEKRRAEVETLRAENEFLRKKLADFEKLNDNK